MEPKDVKVPNTLRVVIPAERKMEVTRSYFVKKVVKGIMKADGRSVLCVQDFLERGWIDVTFPTQQAFSEACGRLTKGDREVLRGLRYVWKLERTVIVHMFNPFVAEEHIRMFLNRHCRVVRDGTKLIDEDGFWTGKRRYTVGLKSNEKGEEVWPPHSFALGPDRGYLFFPGHAGVCWSCGAQGHVKEQCTKVVCRQCGSSGHMAKECKAPKSCSLCGEVGHLFRACPYRREEWSSAMEPADPGPVPVRPPEQGRPGKSAGVSKAFGGDSRNGGHGEKGAPAGAHHGVSVSVSGVSGVSGVAGAGDADDGKGRAEVVLKKTVSEGAGAPPQPMPPGGRGRGKLEVEPGGLLPGWDEVLQKAAEGDKVD